MLYESSLEFGRNSKAINEAYAKMCNEGADGAEYRLMKDGKEVPTTDSDELTDAEMEAYRRNRKMKPVSAKRKLPEWLVSAAKAHGKTLEEPKEEETPQQEVSNSEDDEFFSALNGDNATDAAQTDAEGASDADMDDEEDAGDPELEANGTYFYQNVIEGNPEEFNDERYDMNTIASSNKKSLMDTAVSYIESGKATTPEDAVKKIFFEMGFMKPETATEYQEMHSYEYGHTDGVSIDDDGSEDDSADSGSKISASDKVGNIDASDSELREIERKERKYERQTPDLSDDALLKGLSKDEDGYYDV